MAVIRTRTKKDGSVSYQAVVRISGQPEARRTFSDKKSAQIWADITTAAARESATRLPDTTKFRRILLRDALLNWKKHLTCPKSNARHIPTIAELVGNISLGNLNREHVVSYIQKLRQTNSLFGRNFADSTILRHMVIIRGAVKHAAALHRVTFDLSIFNIYNIEGAWDVERERTLKPEEEKLLRASIETRRYKESWRLLLDLAIETFAREQELVLADISEVNFATRVWRIPKEHAKSGYARDIPLSNKAHAAMVRLKERLDSWNAQNASSANQKKQTRLFFEFSSPSSVCSGFRKLTQHAGIEDFHFHDLRHTGITRAALEKRSLEVHEIMRISGHKSMGMFLRYSNIRAEDLVNRMN